jgi:hypothetical protein
VAPDIDDDSLRWLMPVPDLSDPVLIVMLTGWIDAGGAARAAAAAIEVESDASPVAEFDDDTYIDYRARRPVMELREGLNSVLEWERITLATGRDQAGHDLIVLSGPEPDMAWHRFTRVVGALATELGVPKMAHFGAYPFAVPHTRPARISVSSPSYDVLAKVPFLRSSIDVPAGVAASLEHEMHDRGIPSLGIWAQVPHYVSAMEYPAASVALLEGLEEVSGVAIDALGLRAEVDAQRNRLDRMIAEKPENEAMLRQLEELHDLAPTNDDDGEVSELELRSGDEIAAEIQEFFKDQP